MRKCVGVRGSVKGGGRGVKNVLGCVCGGGEGDVEKGVRVWRRAGGGVKGCGKVSWSVGKAKENNVGKWGEVIVVGSVVEVWQVCWGVGRGNERGVEKC